MAKEIDELLRQALQRKPGRIEAMSDEERREYNRQAKAASRERQRDKVGKPSESTVREILADIAIMMLATNAEGSATIQKALERHFGERVGFPVKIKSDARRGKLRPKVIRPARDAAA